MQKILNKYVKKNKRGASMLDFFIYALVILMVGSAVFILGGFLKGGIGTVKEKAENVTTEAGDKSTGYDDLSGFNDN